MASGEPLGRGFGFLEPFGRVWEVRFGVRDPRFGVWEVRFGVWRSDLGSGRSDLGSETILGPFSEGFLRVFLWDGDQI